MDEDVDLQQLPSPAADPPATDEPAAACRPAPLVLNATTDNGLDDLVRMAAQILDCPMAQICNL